MFSLSAALDFIDVFFTTMAREWYGIDRLRLDKFYMVRTSVCNRPCRWVRLKLPSLVLKARHLYRWLCLLLGLGLPEQAMG